MSVPDYRFYVSASTKIGDEYVTGIRVTIHKGSDQEGWNEVWAGTTGDRAGVFTEWGEMSQFGLRIGDVVKIVAIGWWESVGYSQVKLVNLYSDAIYRFTWARETAPTPRHWVTIEVEADLPDPMYTGPHEVPIVRTGLAGVRLLFKQGFTVVVDAVTDNVGRWGQSMPRGTYSLTMSKEGYQSITDELVLTDTLVKRYFMEPGEDKPIIELPDWEKYLTWGNIAKAGAIVVLVGFGSEAFLKFKEAFKK